MLPCARGCQRLELTRIQKLGGERNMKALGAVAVIFAILLAGGAITSNLLSSDLAIQQTTDPSGDFLTATPDQAIAFLLITGFILFNVLGAGLTVMAVFWLLNRGLASVRQGSTS